MAEFFAIGLGYSVRPLAQRLCAEGWSVRGTTRSAEKAQALEAESVAPFIWDGRAQLSSEHLAEADLVAISVPPDEGGCPAARAIQHVSPDTVLLYLSSSGVYGDHDGAWVDEETPCHPTTARGRRRLMAEQQWQDISARCGARLHVCRLAGIYGPGRNAIESLKEGTRGAKAGLTQRVIKPGQVFNRIHRDDIVAALHALITAAQAPTLLNIADDNPSPPQDVITYAAELLEVKPPQEVAFEEADLSPMARSFYTDNKRLRNEHLKSLPGFVLRYPTYRDGLRALLSDQA